MKKRLTSLVLVTLLITSLALPAGAAVSVPSEVKIDSGISVSEYKDGHLTIKEADRSAYLKNNAPTSDSVDYDEIRKELATLGISQQTIDDMEDWYLLEYAQSPSIVYSSGYYEIDSSGTATPISEQTALQNVVAAQKKLSSDANAQRERKLHNESDFLYLELVIVFFPGQSGLFSHRTEARWLIPPTNLRGNDYIGSSAQLSAIRDDTRAGWVKYTKNSHNAAGDIISDDEETYNFTKSNFKNVENGTFSGSAGYFPLPKDEYHQGGTPTKTYTDIRAAYYFQANVINYTSPQNLKMTASYLHQVYGITITPSLVIDNGTKYTGSIGVSISTGYSREINLSDVITYTPS